MKRLAGMAAVLLLAACAPARATAQPAQPVLPAQAPASAPNPAATTCTAPGSPPNPNVAAPAAPHGIFVLSPSHGATGDALLTYLLHNPDICGADFWVNWAQIDSGPGIAARYDWSSVLKEIAPWEAAGKTVNLIVVGAAEGAGTTQLATPKWVQSQVQLISCTNNQPTPVFWQPGYEKNWEGFISVTVKQFAGDPHVGYIRFGLGHGGEDLVATDADTAGPCKQSWDAAGYQTQWMPYNDRLLDFMGSLHSSKQLMVGLNNFNGGTSLGADVAERAAALGIGFGMQGLASADVASVSQHQPCRDADWCTLFQKYAGKVPLETQTLAASNPAGGTVKRGVAGTAPGSTLSGLTGPLPPLLQTALAVHTQIFEIYADDALVAFDPAWPGYQQYHDQYAQAFDATAAAVGTAAAN